MKDTTRQYGCVAVAVALVIAGTIGTGLAPPTALYQALAGSLIVAGFAVSYLCLGGFDLRE